jgi:predicted dehydrogenase
MNKGNMSRRGFLANSLTGLMAAGLPAWFAKDLLAQQQEEAARQARQPNGANDRIVMAAIGVGTNYTRRGGGPVRGERGIQIMEDARRQRGVQFVAVCDVDRHNRDFAARLVGRGCRAVEDFREVLRNRDIQAVTIGTPDHWHALIAVAAMRAGKDVYCEKPLTLTIDEGKGIVRVAAATNKIMQTGSQQRTEFNGRFRLACDLVRNNRIGRVRRITTLIGGNPRGGPFATRMPPDGLNWNFWLGQTPRVDYVPERCHYEFRWWYEYSGGKMTDWGAHHNDVAQWALNMDNSGPVQVEGTGQMPDRRPNCYNCHPTFTATYTYANGPRGANGTVLVCRDGPPADFPARNGARPHDNGVLFEGENNRWIFVNRGLIMASDGNATTSRIITEALPAGAPRLPVASSQMGNFIDCVRSRRQPICNPTVGHRSATVCHLGNIAIRTGRRLRWDPAQERFTGDHAEEANGYLTRPMRGEWAAFWRQQLGNP